MGKGFSFHFLTIVAFVIASFYWVSIVLGCVFKQVEGIVRFGYWLTVVICVV